MKLEKYLGVIAKSFEWFSRKFENNLIIIASAKFYWANTK